jgi:hypothetical protein
MNVEEFKAVLQAQIAFSKSIDHVARGRDGDMDKYIADLCRDNFVKGVEFALELAGELDA